MRRLLATRAPPAAAAHLAPCLASACLPAPARCPQVRTSEEIFALLEQGSAKRRTAETLLNKQSSRSHSGVRGACLVPHSAPPCNLPCSSSGAFCLNSLAR